MKKLISVLYSMLIFFVLISCDNGNQGKSNDTVPEEGKENKNYLQVTFADEQIKWDASYNNSTKELVLQKGYRNIEFPFQYWNTIDASDYSYAELTYSKLSVPQVVFSVIYDDKSYSTVYLQPYTNKAYVKLDDTKKKSIKSIKFQSNIWETYPIDSVSFTFDDFRFVKEKEVIKYSQKKDVVSGHFNDSITGMELSEKLAVGWNISRTSTCPYYNTRDLEYMTFGNQEEIIPLLDSEGKYTYDNNGNLIVKEKKLGTTAQGFALEGNLLPPESHEYITAGYKNGLKSIRINVTWFPHIIDENYTINPYWMERVKELVDWAIADGYYVILNDHHSVYKYMKSPIGYACGYNINTADKAESERFLSAIWKQIAETFNGSYDEHLIFETLNEPRKSCSASENSDGEWWPYTLSSAEKTELTSILNEYNQVIVDTIRKTGGNNSKRFILVPTYATDVSTLFNCGFKLPNDSAENKLMVALHWYPMLTYQYKNIFDYEKTSLKQEFSNTFAKIYEEYTSKGIPVCMTEFNVPNLGDYKTPYSDKTRYDCLNDFCKIGGTYKVSMTLWEDGMVHGVINRSAPYNPTETFLPDLLASWKDGWDNGKKSKSIDMIFAENQASATALLNAPVILENWGNETSVIKIEANKLSGLKEGSIIKLGFANGTGFKNFAFHNGSGGWNKIVLTGTFYSKKAYKGEGTDAGNINFENEVSDIYIQLSQEDVKNLKDGFSIHGMNLEIKCLDVIF